MTENNPPRPIGQIIRAARHKLGMSQYALADELATISGKPTMGRDRVARWERGRQVPRTEWRQWLSAVLKVPREELDAGAVTARRLNRLGDAAGTSATPSPPGSTRRMQGTPALLPVFRSRVAAGVLAAVLLNPDRAFSLTELAEHAGASLASVSKEAQVLERAGILRSRNDGAIRLTQAATERPMLAPLTELIRVTYGVPQVIAEEFGNVPGVARIALTGTWAERFAGITGPEPATIQVRLGIANHKSPSHAALTGASRRAERRLKRPVRFSLMALDKPMDDDRARVNHHARVPAQRARPAIVHVRPAQPPDGQLVVTDAQPLGADVVSRLLDEGQLELISGQAASGDPYFDLAAHHISAAEHVISLAPSSAFVLVCQAAQLVGAGLLAGEGLRPAAGSSPTAVTEAVAAQFGGQFGQIELLRRRFLGVNSPTGRDNRATADDVEAYLPTVRSLLKEARDISSEQALFV